MNEQNLDEAKTIEYDILLRLKKNRYFLQIRELNIFATGSNLEETYQDLISKKDQLINEFQSFEILKELPHPDRKLNPMENSAPKRYAPFLVKTFTIGLILIISLVFSGHLVVDKAVEGSSQIAKQMNGFLKINIGRKLEKELFKAAEKEVSPAKQEKLIKSIRKIVADYKPVADEIKLLFSDKG